MASQACVPYQGTRRTSSVSIYRRLSANRFVRLPRRAGSFSQHRTILENQYCSTQQFTLDTDVSGSADPNKSWPLDLGAVPSSPRLAERIVMSDRTITGRDLEAAIPQLHDSIPAHETDQIKSAVQMDTEESRRPSPLMVLRINRRSLTSTRNSNIRFSGLPRRACSFSQPQSVLGKRSRLTRQITADHDVSRSTEPRIDSTKMWTPELNKTSSAESYQSKLIKITSVASSEANLELENRNSTLSDRESISIPRQDKQVPVSALGFVELIPGDRVDGEKHVSTRSQSHDLADQIDDCEAQMQQVTSPMQIPIKSSITRRSLTAECAKSTHFELPHRHSCTLRRNNSSPDDHRTSDSNAPGTNDASSLVTKVRLQRKLEGEEEPEGIVTSACVQSDVTVDDQFGQLVTEVQSPNKSSKADNMSVTLKDQDNQEQARLPTRESSLSSLSSLSSSEDNERSSKDSLPAAKMRKVGDGRHKTSDKLVRNSLAYGSFSRSSTPITRSSSTTSVSDSDEDADAAEPSGTLHPLKPPPFIDSPTLKLAFTKENPPLLGSSKTLVRSKPIKSTFKSPMLLSTKPQNRPRQGPASRSIVGQQSSSSSSTDPSKLTGILLKKKLVELEQTLTLIHDAERIISSESIRSIKASQEKWKLAGRKAAEYLWKITDHSSKSEKPSGYTDSGFSSSTTQWGDTWGFSQSSSFDVRSKSSEKRDIDDSLTGYVSDEEDEELPEIEDLLADTTVRRYDCSGALITAKEKNIISTIEPLVESSANENVRSSCSLGNMMNSMGIEPSVFGWDDEQEDWKA